MDEPMEPPEYAYDSSGVDMTLIRRMLNMTPADRLQVLPRMTKPDFGCLLRLLVKHGVDFIEVGGVGAILLRHALEESRRMQCPERKKSPISRSGF